MSDANEPLLLTGGEVVAAVAGAEAVWSNAASYLAPVDAASASSNSFSSITAKSRTYSAGVSMAVAPRMICAPSLVATSHMARSSE